MSAAAAKLLRRSCPALPNGVRSGAKPGPLRRRHRRTSVFGLHARPLHGPGKRPGLTAAHDVLFLG